MERSPLNKLSPELRNTIYAMTVCEPEGICLYVNNVLRTSELPPLQVSGLTETCKQIREECLPMMFSVNCFTFRTSILGEYQSFDERVVVDRSRLVKQKLQRALKSMGGGMAHIRTIEVDLGCFRMFDQVVREMTMYGTITKLKQVLSVTKADVVVVFGLQWAPEGLFPNSTLSDITLPPSDMEKAEHGVKGRIDGAKAELEMMYPPDYQDWKFMLTDCEATMHRLFDLLY
ncbi:hypothetical protein LTR37_009273 [Vermiconidia calcicola]|uniref:Uncharacterized protein n=1 Tax=Vermiconidia calcicola TaxID=1690605 RepID=A0ACC3N8K4_9PEZI|nr:hypothetical protein LTR37_009273 [Vermiconidia calcicola]